jgi:hypothetical protein
MAVTRLTLLSLLALIPSSLAAPKTKAAAASSSTSPSAAPGPSPSAPPTRSHPTSLPHLLYTGTPTTTGALSASLVGTGVAVVPLQPTATTYPSDGQLHDPQPAPYVPAGGIGTNATPVYNVKSDFDYESLVGCHPS